MKRIRYKPLSMAGRVLAVVLALLIILTSCTTKSPPADDPPIGGSIEEDPPPEKSVIPGKDEGKNGEDADPGDDNPADDPLNGDDPDGDNPDDDPPDDPPPEPPPFGRVAQSERVDDSYFDDAVFIGDSVSLMLQYNAMRERKENPTYLGAAQFLTAGSFSYSNALAAISDKSVHPTYQGEKHYVEDSIAKMGAKKVYIMLGMNEIGNANYERTFENLETVVGRILAKSPDVMIFFQSVTPRMENSQLKSLNNEIIHGYNALLEKYCEDNGYYYLDIASVVADGDGHLLAHYCSDPVTSPNGMGIHFTYGAAQAWTDYLYTHAIVWPPVSDDTAVTQTP